MSDYRGTLWVYSHVTNHSLPIRHAAAAAVNTASDLITRNKYTVWVVHNSATHVDKRNRKMNSCDQKWPTSGAPFLSRDWRQGRVTCSARGGWRDGSVPVDDGQSRSVNIIHRAANVDTRRSVDDDDVWWTLTRSFCDPVSTAHRRIRLTRT